MGLKTPQKCVHSLTPKSRTQDVNKANFPTFWNIRFMLRQIKARLKFMFNAFIDIWFREILFTCLWLSASYFVNVYPCIHTYRFSVSVPTVRLTFWRSVDLTIVKSTVLEHFYIVVHKTKQTDLELKVKSKYRETKG